MCFSHGGISRTRLDTEGGSTDILPTDFTVRLSNITLAMTCYKAANRVPGSIAMAGS